MQLLHDLSDEIAALKDLVLRVVVRLGILVERVLGAGDAGNRRRTLVLDEEPRLRAVQLNRRVALNHDAEAGEDEDRRRDGAIPIEHREAVRR